MMKKSTTNSVKKTLKAIKGDDFMLTWAPIIAVVLALVVIGIIALGSGAHW